MSEAESKFEDLFEGDIGDFTRNDIQEWINGKQEELLEQEEVLREQEQKINEIKLYIASIKEQIKNAQIELEKNKQ